MTPRVLPARLSAAPSRGRRRFRRGAVVGVAMFGLAVALCGGGCLAEPPGSFAGDSGQLVVEVTATPHCRGATTVRLHSAIVDDGASIDDRFIDVFPCFQFVDNDVPPDGVAETISYTNIWITSPLPRAAYDIYVELVDPPVLAMPSMTVPVSQMWFTDPESVPIPLVIQ
jgi:hypothetical protein